MADVYWIGQDGNIWFKGEGGVTNRGSATNGQFLPTDTGLVDRFADYEGQPGSTIAATRIDDPALSGGGSSAPTGGTSSGVTLNRAGVDNTQRTIDQIPGLLEAALAAERTRFGNTVNEFNTNEQSQRKSYEAGTVTNQKNYDANYMDSIRAGSKGVAGLMALLRGTGAAGGTAEDIARDTVGGVTANDIRGGADTREENQVALDSSLSGFLSDLDRKRKLAEDTRVNNERAIARDSDTQMQELFGKMAGFYGDAGDAGSATSWMNRAGELTPRIAANSRAQVSAYDTAPVTIKAPELAAFAGPTQPSVVTAPNGQVGSGIFTMTDPRRRRESTTPVPVGV